MLVEKMNEFERAVKAPALVVSEYFEEIRRSVDLEIETALEHALDKEKKAETNRVRDEIIDILKICENRLQSNDLTEKSSEFGSKLAMYHQQLEQNDSSTCSLQVDVQSDLDSLTSKLFNDASYLLVKMPGNAKFRSLVILDGVCLRFDEQVIFQEQTQTDEPSRMHEILKLLKLKSVCGTSSLGSVLTNRHLSFEKLVGMIWPSKTTSFDSSTSLPPDDQRSPANVYWLGSGALPAYLEGKAASRDLFEWKHIDLTYIELTDMSLDAFSSLTQVTTSLDLSNNKLACLRKKVFAPLINLSKLDLSLNAIAEIEAGAFDELIQLTELDLGCNKLKKLSRQHFSKLKRLTRLFLGDNCLGDSLSRDMFADLDSLEELGLQGNSIKLLPSSVFRALNKLNFLNLEGNMLEEFDADRLFGSRLTSRSQLKEIHLGYNKMSIITANSFRAMTSLRYLDLQQNKLDEILEGAFADLASLENLFLHYNKLRRIHSLSFAHMSSLTCLSLECNNLELSEVEGLFHLVSYYKTCSYIPVVVARDATRQSVHLLIEYNNFKVQKLIERLEAIEDITTQ